MSHKPMEVTTPAQQERAEVARVLQSGLLTKAPRLESFFRYICGLHLDGRADEIKEYCIAVGALGRPGDFDPKKDSIVRVEALRLRKRLQEFYAGPGANHPVEIVIPNGQYRPQFLHRETGAPDAAGGVRNFAPLSSVNIPDLLASAPPAAPSRKPWGKIALLMVVALTCVAAAVLAFKRRNITYVTPPPPASASEMWTGPASEPALAELRILSGYHGPPFTDRQGHTWAADAYYTGGVSARISPDHFIEAQPDPHLLHAQRSGQFRYDIPLRQATYELHLYFAETEFGGGNPKGAGDATRTFSVSVNGTPKLPDFDPMAEAGSANRLHERVLKDVVPGTEGKLHLGFDPVNGSAFINAIEILPTAPGRIHPIRIVTQGTSVTDGDGRLWAADEYFCGGTTVFRRNVVINRSEKVLYQGERYGNFSYHIPLAPGKYRLTLHFAETWFGTPESHQPALGGRLFDVFANGAPLLKNFQIAAEAGGSNRSVDKVFNNLQPNAQGMLLLQFLPVKNYAEVNAIELVETD